MRAWLPQTKDFYVMPVTQASEHVQNIASVSHLQSLKGTEGIFAVLSNNETFHHMQEHNIPRG